MESKNIYAIALSICSSPTLNKIWDLIQSYEPNDIYERLSETGDLKTQGFITTKYSDNPMSAAESILVECSSKDITILTYWDQSFPKLLREISRPPIVLYCKGSLTADKSVAIVGTRKAGKKSAEIARHLSGDLSLAGYTIVSGMAIGIDREAHWGALKNSGSTIGVLANGIDVVYPAYNRDIYSAIYNSEKSSLISEYPPGIHAGTWTFVRRNRIISGLSIGTVIVKAAKKSGALITANYALEQNREIFACPGHTFDASYEGCNDLIRNGATLVSCTDDILNELSGYKERITSVKIKRSLNKKPVLHEKLNAGNELPLAYSEKNYPKDSLENKILKLLSAGETDIDSIIRTLNRSTNEISEAIIMLELSNEITRDGNMICRYM